MSGDATPRKRGNKRRKKDVGNVHVEHATAKMKAPFDEDDCAPPLAPGDERIHVQKESSTGGGVISKVIFFILFLGLLGTAAVVILEYRGTSDVDIPTEESRFGSLFAGWVDETPEKHDVSEEEEGHEEDHAEEQEHSGEEEEAEESEEDHAEEDDDIDELLSRGIPGVVESVEEEDGDVREVEEEEEEGSKEEDEGSKEGGEEEEEDDEGNEEDVSAEVEEGEEEGENEEEEEEADASQGLQTEHISSLPDAEVESKKSKDEIVETIIEQKEPLVEQTSSFSSQKVKFVSKTYEDEPFEKLDVTKKSFTGKPEDKPGISVAKKEAPSTLKSKNVSSQDIPSLPKSQDQNFGIEDYEKSSPVMDNVKQESKTPLPEHQNDRSSEKIAAQAGGVKPSVEDNKHDVSRKNEQYIPTPQETLTKSTPETKQVENLPVQQETFGKVDNKIKPNEQPYTSLPDAGPVKKLPLKKDVPLTDEKITGKTKLQEPTTSEKLENLVDELPEKKELPLQKENIPETAKPLSPAPPIPSDSYRKKLSTIEKNLESDDPTLAEDNIINEIKPIVPASLSSSGSIEQNLVDNEVGIKPQKIDKLPLQEEKPQSQDTYSTKDGRSEKLVKEHIKIPRDINELSKSEEKVKGISKPVEMSGSSHSSGKNEQNVLPKQSNDEHIKTMQDEKVIHISKLTKSVKQGQESPSQKSVKKLQLKDESHGASGETSDLKNKTKDVYSSKTNEDEIVNISSEKSQMSSSEVKNANRARVVSETPVVGKLGKDIDTSLPGNEIKVDSSQKLAHKQEIGKRGIEQSARPNNETSHWKKEDDSEEDEGIETEEDDEGDAEEGDVEEVEGAENGDDEEESFGGQRKVEESNVVDEGDDEEEEEEEEEEEPAPLPPSRRGRSTGEQSELTESEPVYGKANITNNEDFVIRQQLDEAEAEIERDPGIAVASFSAILRNHPRSPRAFYGRAKAIDRLAAKQQSNHLLGEAIDAYISLLLLSTSVTTSSGTKDTKAVHVPDALYKAAGEECINRIRFRGHHHRAEQVHHLLEKRFPDEPRYPIQLAVTYLMENRLQDAKLVLQGVLRRWPDSGLALVHMGFILKATAGKLKEEERKMQLEMAAAYLKRGIATGEEGTNDGRFFFTLGDSLVRLDRREEAEQVYEDGAAKGLFLSKYQRSLYNVDHLMAKPWWTPEETTYASFFKNLEDNWKVIRDEGLALLDPPNSKNPFKDEAEDLRDVGEWKQLDLYAQGRRIQSNCNRAPKTCKLVSQFPAASSCSRGQIKFSLMMPSTHIWPHCGPTNCRLRSHLGLVVPSGTAIRVANHSPRSWKPGKIFIFDDSFEHEVWHNGTSPRLVLIVDVWHPELSAMERKSLPAI